MEYRESRESGIRIWLRIRPDQGGAIRVEAIQCSELNPTNLADDGRAPTWAGTHPPLGRWKGKTLKTFLGTEVAQAHRPVCVLDVRPTDAMEDFVECLRAVRAAAGPRVLAEIHAR